MEKILLLHEEIEWDSRIMDYLLLSGYEIQEGCIEDFEEIQHLLQSALLILFACNDTEKYVQYLIKIRQITPKPIMVITDNRDEWGRVKMFQAGADDYLISPYLQTELMARIRAHINCYYRLSGPIGIIKVRELVINTFSREVYLKNELIPLRLKEYEILLYLAQNPNCVIKKEEIYHAVWKTEDGPGEYSNTVAVHVKRIRERIEEDLFHPQYVETVWGYGYRFLGENFD